MWPGYRKHVHSLLTSCWILCLHIIASWWSQWTSITGRKRLRSSFNACRGCGATRDTVVSNFTTPTGIKPHVQYQICTFPNRWAVHCPVSCGNLLNQCSSEGCNIKVGRPSEVDALTICCCFLPSHRNCRGSYCLCTQISVSECYNPKCLRMETVLLCNDIVIAQQYKSDLHACK